MKLFKYLLMLGLLVASNQSFAQDKKKIDTTTFRVEGVCGMCKDRIENAALIKGVKMAQWDKKTHVITVVYKPSKTDTLKIHQAIAEKGHSTSLVKAQKIAYDKLPACCAYEEVEDH